MTENLLESALKHAVKYDGERQLENDEKKIRKLDKKVEGKRHMAAVYIRDLKWDMISAGSWSHLNS
ncbi:MAG: hypothetical protein V8Q42_09080 [Anaerovoracaceae bacterium]